jgi:AcrR family transcriptional regulator
MRPDSRDKRRDEILDTAMALLCERGYNNTSMLEVARRASASKETLYAWFGDKHGLFEALIRRNAQVVQTVLAAQFESGADATVEHVLYEFGRALLGLLLGDHAVAINRAAISEAKSDPALGRILAAAGRDATLPAFVGFLERQAALGHLTMDGPQEAAADFLGLLLGDRQIRRLLGTMPAPDDMEIDRLAARASNQFLTLYAGNGPA